MDDRLQIRGAELGRVIEVHDGFLILRALAEQKEDRMKLGDFDIASMEYLI